MSCVDIYNKYNCIQNINIVFFLYVFTLRMTMAQNNELRRVNASLYDHNRCSCKHFDCTCCEHVEWDEVKWNATICMFAAYLDEDYGISAGITYNGKPVINETVSARHPPPICIGENVIEKLQALLCLQLYDVEVNRTFFHACSELDCKLGLIKILPIQMGCFTIGHNNSSSSISLRSHTYFTKHLYFFIFSIVVPNIVFY